jgi:FMN reductase
LLTVVGLAGSPCTTSRTRAIVKAVMDRIAAQAGAKALLVDVADLVGDLQAIESASLLVVGSPVYKGSYTGLLKHLIDLINYPALLGTPVALLAAGGSDRHALVIEHQLRPLFAFFGAKTLATGVFLTDKTIQNGWVEDSACSARLDQLVAEAVHELNLARTVRASAVR